MMISRARSAWRGGQGVWLPGPATHSETRGNHRWGRSELWIIFATSSKVSKLEDGCRSHRQTSNVTGPRGSQGVEVRFEFSWQHKIRVEICHDRRDRRSFKICASCVIFSRKQRIFLQNLLRSAKFTLNKYDFTLKLLKFYTLSSILTKKLLKLLILVHLRRFIVNKNSV